MIRFHCETCAAEVHFDNTHCLSCGGTLGLLPPGRMLSSTHVPPRWMDGVAAFVPCANRDTIDCNWLVPASRAGELCVSCAHTETIPDLSMAGNAARWKRLESAKRHLFYSLVRFGLPLEWPDAPGRSRLRFEFKGDELTADGATRQVMTGHDNGLVTLNVAEADDDLREQHRVAMGEPYRTLIGHFRHEIGHYYWDLLVRDGSRLGAFRAAFGDERADYGAALAAHYRSGPPMDWQRTHVSTYATSHPWEDFAETWAHYFHIVDGLETAAAYGLDFEWRGGGVQTPYGSGDIAGLVRDWVSLAIAMNAMNRSLGHTDFYPFVLTDTVRTKLAFVHDLVHGHGHGPG